MLSNKEEKFIDAALAEMFRLVDRKYSPKATSSPEWYYESTWTSQQQEQFREWLTKLIRRDLRHPAYKADRAADWFVFNYGWRVEEQRIAQAPAPVTAGNRKKRPGIAPHNPEQKR